MPRLAALVLTLTLAAAAPTAARAGEPAAEPPEVAALEWREACTLEPTRVDVPLGRDPGNVYGRMQADRAQDPAAWNDHALVLLGAAFAQGQVDGPPDPRQAARLYCLALRHHGTTLAGLFLADQHATGAIGPPSPELARHFARIAAIHWSRELWASVLATAEAPMLPSEDDVGALLDAGEAWYAEVLERPHAEQYTLAMRYIEGDGVPVSERLGDLIFENAAFGSPELMTRYVERQIRAHPRLLTRERNLRRLVLRRLSLVARIDRVPRAQRLAGELHLRGFLVPEDPVRAYVWFRLAEAGGAEMDIDLERLRTHLSPAQRQRAREIMDTRRPPSDEDWEQPITPDDVY